MVGFPLLLIPLAIYNIIVWLMPGVSLADPIFKLTLVSGAEWPVTLNTIVLALAALMLMFEVIKGARPGAKYLTDLLLSLIVTGAAAAEFLLWPKFGTSTYFLLALMSLVDFLTSIALRTRRNAVVSAAPAPSRKSAKTVQPAVVAEPQFEPAPTPAPVTMPTPAPPPAMPAATSVAESVLLDHPAPRVPQPVVTPAAVPHVEPAPVASSPEVPSPDLQPGNGVTPPEAPKP